MGRKIKINKAIGLISVLIIFTGIIYGCYTRDVSPEVKNIYGQSVKPRTLSDEELRKFAGSVRKVDGEAEAHYKMALYFQERRRHKLAVDELKQVLKRDPASAKAYNAIGVSYDNLGDNDAAIDYYKMALQIDSRLDYVYNNLGYSYLLKNDVQKAVESFQQAVALNEKEKRYSNNLGLAYARQGKYELAFDQFKSLDSDANAEKMLTKVMKDLGKGAETEAVLAAARNAPKTEAVAAKASDSSEILVQSVLPEPVPQSSQVAVAEVKPETPKEVIAEVKAENSIDVVTEVKPESPRTPVIDITPSAPLTPQKPEETLVAAVQPLNVQPESKPVIKEDPVVEVKLEAPKVVVAEVKAEVPEVVVAEAKQENPKVVAEVKAETPKNPVLDIAPSAQLTPQKPEETLVAAVQPLNVQPESKPVIKEDAAVEVKPEAPEVVVAEVKTEVPKVTIAEVKPEVPKVVVADVKPEKPQDVVAEVKTETPKAVVAEFKPETLKNPVSDNNPPAQLSPQNPKEVRIAAVQPLNAQPDSKAVIKEDVKSDSVSVSAVFQPSGRGPGASTIQVHEMRVFESSSSTQAGGSQVAHDNAASKQIEIAVENGNGVKGAAGRMAELLRQKGFKVVKVSDARSFDHFNTKVFYESDDLIEVQQLLRVIPESPYSAELYKMVKMGPPPIRLLIGKDLVKKETSLARGKKPAALKAESVDNTSKSPNPKKKKA